MKQMTKRQKRKVLYEVAEKIASGKLGAIPQFEDMKLNDDFWDFYFCGDIGSIITLDPFGLECRQTMLLFFAEAGL